MVVTYRRSVLLLVLVATAILGTTATPAHAYIRAMFTLEQVLGQTKYIAVGRMIKVDPRGKTAVMQVDKMIRGKAEYRNVNMNIGAGPGHHAAYLAARLRVGAPAILFYRRDGGGAIVSLIHSGDTWFQLFANDEAIERDKVWWRFTHIEPHMGRTFNGTTPELIKVTADVVAEKIKPPKPDPKVPMIDPRQFEAPRQEDTPTEPGTEWFRTRKSFPAAGRGDARGISFADVNGDELTDIYVCREQGSAVLVNQSGDFKDTAKDLGIAGGSLSGSWADYDGDDHPDLLTNNIQLLTNAGGRFRDDSRLLPSPPERIAQAAGWIDYNGDGRPDILVANAAHGICLYENTGSGPKWFRDVSKSADLGSQGLGAGGGDSITFWDYDSDGYADLLYDLNGGVLAGNTADGGFKADQSSRIVLPPGPKRGMAAADYDNDGDVDVFVPGKRGGCFYRNNNDGTFTDVFRVSGDVANVLEDSCSAAWGDVDGNGMLDLVICYGPKGVRIFAGGLVVGGDSKGKFKDVSKQAGVSELADVYAAGLADLDNDGDLDIVANLTESIVVAMNQAPRQENHRPLSVDLHVRTGCIGAVVRVLDDRWNPMGLRELNGAEGRGGQASPVANMFVPLGECKVYAALSDGRLASKPLTVNADTKHVKITFEESDFR